MSTAEQARVLRATKMQRGEMDRALREFADAKLGPDVEYSQFVVYHADGDISSSTTPTVTVFRHGPAHLTRSGDHGLWSSWDAKADLDEVFRGYDDWNVLFITIQNTVKKTDLDVLYDGAGCVDQARRVARVKQELVEKTWHPSRFATWCLDTEEASVLGG